MSDGGPRLADSVAARRAFDYPKAIEIARAYLETAPNDPNGHVALAAALAADQRFDEAIESYSTAHRLAPESAEIVNLLAAAYSDAGDLQSALGCAWSLLNSMLTIPEVRVNLSFILMKSGALRLGLREYEWRLQSPEVSPLLTRFTVPLWRGQPIAGARIALYAEQGFGDTLQFLRYVPPLAALGARIVLEVQKPLVRLVRSFGAPHGCLVVARGEAIPDVDWHCPLLSLGAVFGGEIDDIPGADGYITADPELAAIWRARLEDALSARPVGARVGLVWAGGAHAHDPIAAATDRRRSLALASFSPLAGIEGVTFVSLQLGRSNAVSSRFPLVDLTAEISDFADTAALIDALDMVITVDTSVAHLAGAMGKPVWILSRFDGCWRWFMDREDSPWYRSARLFRQPRPGDWEPVINAVAAELGQIEVARV